MDKNNVFMKAVGCYRSNLYYEAISLFEDIIQKHPKHEESYFYLGQCCEKLYFETEAIKYYLKGLKLCKDNDEYISDYNINIGNCYIMLSKPQEAIYHYNEAEKFHGNFLTARFNKACAYMCIKDFETALEILKTICKSNADNTLNERIEEKIHYCDNKIKSTQ